MDTKEDLQEKIRYLKKEIEACKDDAQAILLQKKLIDLFRSIFKNKEYLIQLLSEQKE